MSSRSIKDHFALSLFLVIAFNLEYLGVSAHHFVLESTCKSDSTLSAVIRRIALSAWAKKQFGPVLRLQNLMVVFTNVTNPRFRSIIA